MNKPKIEDKPKFCHAWTSNVSDKVMCNTIPCCGFQICGLETVKRFKESGNKFNYEETGNNQPPYYNDMRRDKALPVAKIEEGEWWVAGHIIQRQEHPNLPKWISFPDDDLQVVSVHSSFKEAVEYCRNNSIENPNHTPKDYL